jgi:hypothetical protein
VISDMSDRTFKRRLDRREYTTPRLLASAHYGPILRAQGAEEELAQMRIEWRERQERARARKLREEASFAD